MTTTITIKHEGPGHNEVLVDRTGDEGRILKEGESVELTLWNDITIEVTEIPN